MSFVSYNIEGIARLYDPEFRAFLSSFDFCLLLETFVLEFLSGPMWFPDHEVFVSPAMRLSETGIGRLSGGLILLMKKEFVKFVEQLHVEYDNIIALKISKDLMGTDVPVVWLGAYLPPSASNYYKDTDIHNGVSILENCMLDLSESQGDVLFFVCGDLNSRTGNENPREKDIAD